jgi:hypothetical protein
VRITSRVNMACLESRHHRDCDARNDTRKHFAPKRHGINPANIRGSHSLGTNAQLSKLAILGETALRLLRGLVFDLFLIDKVEAFGLEKPRRGRVASSQYLIYASAQDRMKGKTHLSAS